MNHPSETRAPAIVVADTESERLRALAAAAMGSARDVAEELTAEMERATVVADALVPRDVVRMGSRVDFETDDGRPGRSVTLVYPAEADISRGRISVLTPVGAALIGLSAGQSIRWITRDGREQVLTVLAVSQHEPTG